MQKQATVQNKKQLVELQNIRKEKGIIKHSICKLLPLPALGLREDGPKLWTYLQNPSEVIWKTPVKLVRI